MPALEAVQEWLVIQEKYPDKELVAPATSGIQTAWMDEFWTECEIRGCRIDYLATHSYNIGQPNKTTEARIGYTGSMRELYYSFCRN